MHQRISESAWDATEYLAPYHRGRVRRRVSISLTNNTYHPGESTDSSWLPIVFRAFSELAKKVAVKDMLIIGSGNGVDALGAIEIFDLEAITVSELFEDNLAVIRDNIIANLEQATETKVSFYAGSLLSFVSPQQRFTLIYENLPNIPLPQGVSIKNGTNSASFFHPEHNGVPELFVTNLLVLHYLLLQQARVHVSAGGGVLTCIGGRVPLEVINKLHRSCGYSPELLVFDVKIQSEAATVLPCYFKAQRKTGVEFQYYLPGAVKIISEARRAGLQGIELATAVQHDLDRLAISIDDALARVRRGKDVAHTVYMIFGRPEKDGNETDLFFK